MVTANDLYQEQSARDGWSGDSEESGRLNTEHELLKALAHGHLINHCIPTASL